MRPGEVLGGRFRIGDATSAEDVVWGIDLGRDAPVLIRRVDRGAHPRVVEQALERARGLEGVVLPPILPLLSSIVRPGAIYWVSGAPHGIDLVQEGRGGRPSIPSVERVAGALASGLASLHARGWVHGDLRPELVWVGPGTEVSIGLPSPGDTLPAPPPPWGGRRRRHLAPEQHRGAELFTPATDVFALGCLVYEWLTGVEAFASDTAASASARVLLVPPIPARTLRRDVPRGLSNLLARMLARAPEDRPADGNAVVADLLALANQPPDDRQAPSMAPALSQRGAVLTAAIVVEAPDDGLAQRALGEIADATEGRLDGWRGLTAMVTSSASADADRVHAVARASLDLRDRLGDATVALAVERTDGDAERSQGRALDRAVRLLERRRRRGPSGVLIDPESTDLLDTRFEIGGTEVTPELWRERAVESAAAGGQAIGRPFVGRGVFMAKLLRRYERAIENSDPAHVLVWGASGSGKTRLAGEWLSALRERGTRPTVIVARGDPLRPKTPLRLLANAFRDHFDLRSEEPLWTAQQKVLRSIVPFVAEKDRRRVGEFLGELCGVPFPDEGSPALAAARETPGLRGDQLRRAIVDFLADVADGGPTVLIIDDLQWADELSLTLIEQDLTERVGGPLFVLALARPEDRERLDPGAWAQVELPPISDVDAERWVTAALGKLADRVAPASLVARAAGNAGFLEELIRAAHEGRESFPETVVSLVEARITALPTVAKSIARAAAVFGMRAPLQGALALLNEEDADGVDEAVELLISRGILIADGPGATDDAEILVFANELVRDASYASLSDEDRRLGHRLAALWLDEGALGDAPTVAAHLERAGDHEKAAQLYRRAAERALATDDAETAIELARRGLSCASAGETSGLLSWILSDANGRRGDTGRQVSWGERAMSELIAGEPRWLAAAAETGAGAAQRGQVDIVRRCTDALLTIAAGAGDEPMSTGMIVAAARLIPPCLDVGLAAQADALWQLLAHLDNPDAHDEPRKAAYVMAASATRLAYADAPEKAAAMFGRAAGQFDEAGDLRQALSARVSAANARAESGLVDAALQLIAVAMQRASDGGLSHDDPAMMRAHAQHDAWSQRRPSQR